MPKKTKSTKPLRPVAASLPVPGPADYKLPATTGRDFHDITRPRAGVVTFGDDFTKAKRERARAKQRKKLRSESCQAPQFHMVDKVTRKGPETTQGFTIVDRKRLIDKSKEWRLSPATYQLVVPRSGPSYSIGTRTPTRRVDSTPAPNSYVLPSTLKGAELRRETEQKTFVSRQSCFVDYRKNPGPNAYFMPSTDVYKRRGPVVSMKGSRPEWPNSRGAQASAKGSQTNAQYLQEGVIVTPATRCPSSGITFGQRHSQYICPYVEDQ